MVAVAFFPAQAARQSAKIPGFLGEFQTQLSVNFEDDQVLPGAELETFAEFFWNHNLKLWRHLTVCIDFHLRKSYRYTYGMSTSPSIYIWYYARDNY